LGPCWGHLGRVMEPARVFVAYSHRDAGLRNELEVHLALLKREGLLDIWHDRMILPGSPWDGEISEHLGGSSVVLVLVSPDFLASEYAYGVETQRALEMHRAGDAVVIPVVLRPCLWTRTPLAELQGLPEDGLPVTQWADLDVALLNVAQGIARRIEQINAAAAAASPPVPAEGDDAHGTPTVTQAVRGDERYSTSALVALRSNAILKMKPEPRTFLLVAPDFAHAANSFIVVAWQSDDEGRWNGIEDMALMMVGGYFAPADMNTYTSGSEWLRFSAPFDRVVAKVYPTGKEVWIHASAEGFATRLAVVHVMGPLLDG
jgi:hypothetical protein